MSELVYTFRDDVPEVLERAADQTVSMEVYRDGALVAPTQAGSTLTILDRNGGTVLAATPIVVVASIATVTIAAASLPATLALGEGWRLRWSLIMAAGLRVKQREAALARFRLHPPVPETLILTQLYPDIVQALGRYATNLQGFMDGAWSYILRALWRVGTWPELIVSQSDLYDPLLHQTVARVGRFLHRLQPNETYWADEAKYHEDKYEAAWSALTVRWDRDQNGRVDSLGREPVVTSIHINVPPTRRWPRDGRF